MNKTIRLEATRNGIAEAVAMAATYSAEDGQGRINAEGPGAKLLCVDGREYVITLKPNGGADGAGDENGLTCTVGSLGQILAVAAEYDADRESVANDLTANITSGDGQFMAEVHLVAMPGVTEDAA